jgi:hypothetical protein
MSSIWKSLGVPLSVRASFVEHFGKEQARALERACNSHLDLMGCNINRGSDPFKYVIIVVIGFSCVEEEEYRKKHGIIISFDEFKEWVKRHGNLASHDGDWDELSVIDGTYKEYINDRKG